MECAEPKKKEKTDKMIEESKKWNKYMPRTRTIKVYGKLYKVVYSKMDPGVDDIDGHTIHVYYDPAEKMVEDKQAELVLPKAKNE